MTSLDEVGLRDLLALCRPLSLLNVGCAVVVWRRLLVESRSVLPWRVLRRLQRTGDVATGVLPIDHEGIGERETDSNRVGIERSERV